jgi:hypothetical protein
VRRVDEDEVLFYETPFLHRARTIYVCGQSEEVSSKGFASSVPVVSVGNNDDNGKHDKETARDAHHDLAVGVVLQAELVLLR